MAVPNTNSFGLMEVFTELNKPDDSSLVGCFAAADDLDFDPAYKGAKDRLSNFRNYRRNPGFVFYVKSIGSSTNASTFVLPIKNNGFVYNVFINDVMRLTGSGFGGTSGTYNHVGEFYFSIGSGTPANPIYTKIEVRIPKGTNQTKWMEWAFDYTGAWNRSGNLDRVTRFGNVKWATMTNAFYGCRNLQMNFVEDAPIVQDRQYIDAFHTCTALTSISNLEKWEFGVPENTANLRGMLYACENFNGALNMNTAYVNSMESMLQYCYAFNEDLAHLDYSGLSSPDGLKNFMANKPAATYSTQKYGLLLQRWRLTIASKALKNVIVGATRYPSSASADRAFLISSGWTIGDGGLDSGGRA